jgi:hypothetical protein
LQEAVAERKYSKDMEGRHRRQAMLNQLANSNMVSLPSYYKEIANSDQQSTPAKSNPIVPKP